MKIRLILCMLMLMAFTGCTEFAVLSSTATIAVSHNAYAKAYSGVDVATFMVTEKDIKTHMYEKATTVKNKINETFILEKPPMLEIEKRVLVALPIIEVKISQLLTVDDGFYIAKNFDNYKSNNYRLCIYILHPLVQKPCNVISICHII